MRRFILASTIVLFAYAPLLAQEAAIPPEPANPQPVEIPSQPANPAPEPPTEAGQGKFYRFAIGAEYGLPGILSGPQLEHISSATARFSFAPSDQFMITLSYTKMTGELAKNDVLSQIFQVDYNQVNDPDINFANATFNNSDVDIEQWVVSLAKSVPLGGRWEAFIGIGFGLQSAQADVSWVDAKKQNGQPAYPTYSASESDVFMTTVRGGARFDITKWFNVQASFELVPIDQLFSEDLSYYALNLGVQFRF